MSLLVQTDLNRSVHKYCERRLVGLVVMTMVVQDAIVLNECVPSCRF